MRGWRREGSGQTRADACRQPLAAAFPLVDIGSASVKIPPNLAHERWLPVLLYGAWALLTLAAFGLAWHGGLQQAARGLEHHAYRHFAKLRDKLRDNEATIHAFAAQLASVPDATPLQIRSLARRLLELHRHIYMLELVQRVPREGLEAFVAQARRDWHPGFRAKTFDYLQTRTWQPLSDKAEYYLLVMLEPDLSGAAALYGLDTDSVPFLRSTLRRSLELGLAIASEPFRLAEDASLAYVMYRPIPAARAGPDGDVTGDRLALLVVTVESLFPQGALDPYNRYRLFYDTRAQGGDEQTLMTRSEAPADWLSNLLLPAHTVRFEADSARQPVGMEISRQIRLADVYNVALPAITLFSLLSLALILLYLRARRQSLALQQRAFVEACHQALHDPLTGLGNRMLLQARLEHALNQAQRSGHSLALLYLDLDGFKQINDRHGHAVGDEVLRLAAQRLRNCLRETDTVARLGGDEFVVMLENIEDGGDIEAVCDKLAACLGQPYPVGGLTLALSVSIGVSRYPEHADDPAGLLQHADADMYKAKRGSVRGT